MRSLRLVAVTALAAVSALGLSRPTMGEAMAEVEAQEAPAAITMHGVVGVGAAAGVQLQPEGRFRADLALSTLAPQTFDWLTAALVFRVAGPPRLFLGLRAGYQLEYYPDDELGFSGSRFAHAVDGSLVAHAESAAGSALEGQIGVEGVFRAAPTRAFDDAALPTASAGLRVAVTGELALSTHIALLAQAELRTGAHLLEIRVLPSGGVGARYRF